MSDARASRYALAFIFVTMFVDTVGLGIIIPVTPKIIAQLTGQGMSEAARYGGWLFFVYALMQFLFAPLIGNLSDRFGRRPVLILALTALSFDYLITGLAPTVWWLFVGRTLSGMAGASYTTANAYIADVSPPEKRAANFGLVGAAFGLGFIVGPAIGGLLGAFGPRVPFFVSAVLAILNALFGLLVLKESLDPAHRRKFELARANPLGALGLLKRFPALFGLFAVVILMRLAHDANPAVFTYYTMLKFGWTMQTVGWAMMVMGALIMFVYGVLTRIVIPRIGEARAVIFGLVAGASAFALYAFATKGWQMFAGMAVFSLWGLSSPALNAIMSRMAPPTEQGELQGVLASIGSLTSIAAPPLLTNLFGYFTSAAAPVYFPGAAFLAGSIFLVAAAATFARARPHAALSPAE